MLLLFRSTESLPRSLTVSNSVGTSIPPRILSNLKKQTYRSITVSPHFFPQGQVVVDCLMCEVLVAENVYGYNFITIVISVLMSR